MLSVSMCMQLHSTALRIVLHGVHRQRSLVRPLGAATVTCCGFPNSQCTSTVASPSQWPLFRHFVRSSRNVSGPWTLFLLHERSIDHPYGKSIHHCLSILLQVLGSAVMLLQFAAISLFCRFSVYVPLLLCIYFLFKHFVAHST